MVTTCLLISITGKVKAQAPDIGEEDPETGTHVAELPVVVGRVCPELVWEVRHLKDLRTGIDQDELRMRLTRREQDRSRHQHRKGESGRDSLCLITPPALRRQTLPQREELHRTSSSAAPPGGTRLESGSTTFGFPRLFGSLA